MVVEHRPGRARVWSMCFAVRCETRYQVIHLSLQRGPIVVSFWLQCVFVGNFDLHRYGPMIDFGGEGHVSVLADTSMHNPTDALHRNCCVLNAMFLTS